MLSNPIVQTVLLFFGAYSLMTVLHRKEPFGLILTALAGAVVVVIWMLRYNRAAAHSAYQNPLIKPVIDLVCSLTKEQPPVDAVDDAAAAPPTQAAAVAAPAGPQRPRQPVSARGAYTPQSTSAAAAPAQQGAQTAAATAPEKEKTPLLLLTESDFKLSIFQLEQQLFGMNQQIESTMAQLQRNLRIRERGSPSVHMPPIGMFLFLGRQGLGKKTLAVEIGRRLYSGRSVAIIDLAESGATLEPMILAAKSNPYQTFVIENVDQASRRTQDELLAIVAGQSLTDSQSGARISFRHACLFLLIHKEPAGIEEPVVSSSAGGFTMAIERVAETSLDQLLAQGLHGVIPFRLPEKNDQAEAIASIMEAECKKYSLTLGSVSPQILAREVQEVSSVGSFKTVPMRVSRVLGRAIHNAIESHSTEVNVE